MESFFNNLSNYGHCNYKNFLLRILKLSTVLIKKGIKPKDRIAIFSENRAEYLELEMACAKIGAIVAAINWRLSDKEVDYCINLVKPKLIILSERFKVKAKLSSIKNLPSIIYGLKYENLINDPEKEFVKLCNFIESISNLRFEKKLILKKIENCNFNNIKKQEISNGFSEGTTNKANLKNEFFKLGPENDWKKLLNKEIKGEIEALFKNEMKEAGYL